MAISIGCITTPKDFAVAGTATDKLYGVAEGLWEADLVSRLLSTCCIAAQPHVMPHQEPEDLFETISQTLLSAVDRDCISGWGGVVYVM